MKIKKLGDITLTFPLWWTNYNDTPEVQAEVEQTITGDVVVWEQARGISGINIDLDSLDDGWQDIATKDAVKALVISSLGVTTTITDTDDNVINVRFRHEVSDSAVDFERLHDTSEFEYYRCSLFLARV